MTVQENAPSFTCFDDDIHSLHCEDEKWSEFDDEEEEADHELQSLFRREKEAWDVKPAGGSSLSVVGREEAVKWMLRVNAHYGFSALTAILAVNYLDRFLASLDGVPTERRELPWMTQLAAVACFSLATKVEETHVPLLLDLQGVGCSEYVFEVKTVERMELLVLSALKWRMNPVTPLSFLHHAVTRLGMKTDHVHNRWETEFRRSCESLLLSVIMSESRMFINYPPSALAAASMLHVLHGFNDSIGYQNQVLALLRTTKEEVTECYQLISDVLSSRNSTQKRKFCQDLSNSPGGSSCDQSSCHSSSSSSSPIRHGQIELQQPAVMLKRSRVQEQRMKVQSSLVRRSFGGVCYK